ncbi:MAG: ribosome recycling factor [Firmicutes bacterium]|nr:ribosome recycling factor [Bacillota bacterium]
MEQVKIIFDKLDADGQKAVDHLRFEFSKIRAGRANPQLFDRLLVEYHGTPTPLNQMGNISVPEPRLIQISVWDASSLKDVEKAIINSDLGLTPTNDGKVIRVAFPELTEERRKDLAKQIKKIAEDVKVALRNVRRDAIDAIKKLEKDVPLSKDDVATNEKEADKVAQKFIEQVDQIFKDKEKEILTV